MLELMDLSKRYGEVVALDGASLQAREGRMLGVLGPNGAGKATAMRSEFGLVDLDAGTVRWAGEPVSARSRLRVGYMPEQRGLCPRMAAATQLVYLAELRGRDRATDLQSLVTDWVYEANSKHHMR